MTREARQHTAHLATYVHTLMEDFDAQHVDLLESLRQARELQAQLEQATRELALVFWANRQAHELRPSKTLYPGVQIRELIRLVYDPEEALAWAKAGNQLAIEPEHLNVPAFEAIAKSFPGKVSFVKQVRTYQVTLAKEL